MFSPWAAASKLIHEGDLIRLVSRSYEEILDLSKSDSSQSSGASQLLQVLAIVSTSQSGSGFSMSQRRATCPSRGSRFLREHDHFAVDDLIFRKKLRGGFRS
jgi:hypothetical protein